MQYRKLNFILKSELANNTFMKLNISTVGIICISILGTILQSCINNENYPELYPTMGTVNNLSDYSINSDLYGDVIPKNPDIIRSYEADSIGQRILVNINFPNAEDKDSKVNTGKEVTIYDLYKVLTKKADDLRLNNNEDKESFGNDLIEITYASISNEHLNIEFNISGSNETIPHRISLLLTENTQIDDEGLLEVELRHNKNSDNGDKLYWGIASFTLSSIPEYSNANFKGFRIKSQSEDNTTSETIVRLQSSSQTRIVRSMESSQEIGNRHSLFARQLQ